MRLQPDFLAGLPVAPAGFLCATAALLPLCLATTRADIVVGFSELMYDPLATNEAASEWIELRNQMWVDVGSLLWQLDTNSLTDAVWSPGPRATSVRTDASTLNLTDPLEGVTATRFYRVVLLP